MTEEVKDLTPGQQATVNILDAINQEIERLGDQKDAIAYMQIEVWRILDSRVRR